MAEAILKEARVSASWAFMVADGKAGTGFLYELSPKARGIKRWAGPQACTGAAFDATNIAAALAAPMIRCDAAAWTLFGVSMAGYNGLVSTFIGSAALWLNRSTR